MNEIATPVHGSGAPLSGARAAKKLTRLLVLGLVVMGVAACGGGSDNAATTTVPTSLVPATTAAPATTATATTAAPFKYVTAGAVVGVANASRINGAAGRLTERLQAVGYTTGAPTNYPLGQIDTTVIFYVPGDKSGQEVAKNLRKALGAGPITLAKVGTPAPTETGELGNITVLVAMGNDIADFTLEELQNGKQPVATTAAPTATTAAPATTVAGSSTAASGTDSSTAASSTTGG